MTLIEFFLYKDLFTITIGMLYIFYKDFYDTRERIKPTVEDIQGQIYLDFSLRFDKTINDLRQENMRLKQEIKFHHIEGVIKEDKSSLLIKEAIALKEKNDEQRFNSAA